jgi:predicted GNAT family acetyltransferase
MGNLTITDNGFLRQFETTVDNHLCKIEYSAQERKIFLTKLIIPKEVNSKSFRDQFIVAVLDEIQEKNLRVVPTCPEVAVFLRKNRRYKEMLPVGIRI